MTNLQSDWARAPFWIFYPEPWPHTCSWETWITNAMKINPENSLKRGSESVLSALIKIIVIISILGQHILMSVFGILNNLILYQCFLYLSILSWIRNLQTTLITKNTSIYLTSHLPLPLDQYYTFHFSFINLPNLIFFTPTWPTFHFSFINILYSFFIESIFGLNSKHCN